MRHGPAYDDAGPGSSGSVPTGVGDQTNAEDYQRRTALSQSCRGQRPVESRPATAYAAYGHGPWPDDDAGPSPVATS